LQIRKFLKIFIILSLANFAFAEDSELSTCLELKGFSLEKDFGEIECLGQYHHYNSDATSSYYSYSEARKKKGIKIGSFNLYQSGSSRQATDFLQRLVYLTNGKLKIIHSDNGSEFAGEFEKACFALGISQVYSRARTPKDNPSLERFNWTIQDEWLSMSEVGLDDIQEANLDLTAWLIEYNSVRPHQTLDYQTPLSYAQTYKPEVLPMTPARTQT